MDCAPGGHLEVAWDRYDDALSMVREFGEWPPRDFLHGIETDIYVARVVTDPRVVGALRKAEIRFMVIGGQAVIVHGEPRLTRDIGDHAAKLMTPTLA